MLADIKIDNLRLPSSIITSSLAEQVFIPHHQMDLSKVIDAHLHTHRPIACWSPVISNMSRPLSIGEGAQCQESIPPYWTGITLYLLLFDFTNLSLYGLRYNVLLTCISSFSPCSCISCDLSLSVCFIYLYSSACILKRTIFMSASVYE